MKVNCPYCKESKHCHIIWQHKTEYHSEFGIDEVTKVKIKIHKHHKGTIQCRGSNKIIYIKCLEDAEYLHLH